MPKKIVFVEGEYGGLTFVQGAGPAKRIDLGGGVSFLANSTNFWYNDSNRTVSAVYLEDHRSQWVACQ